MPPAVPSTLCQASSTIHILRSTVFFREKVLVTTAMTYHHLNFNKLTDQEKPTSKDFCMI
jgi:hypothetical protein